MAKFEEIDSKITELNKKISVLSTVVDAVSADVTYAVSVLAQAPGGLSGEQVAVLFEKLVGTDAALAAVQTKLVTAEGKITPPTVEFPLPA